jgi:hypothetical protein
MSRICREYGSFYALESYGLLRPATRMALPFLSSMITEEWHIGILLCFHTYMKLEIKAIEGVGIAISI